MAPILTAVSPYGLERRIDICQGTVLLDGLSMHRLAWELYDLSELHNGPAQRGDNRLLPGNPGTISYPPRKTQTRFSLPFLICGAWNLNDDYVDADDRWEQLASNMAYLMDNVWLPTGVSGGTRTLEWDIPGAVGTVTSEVQVLPAQPPRGLGDAAVFVTTLELLAPDGDLHL